MATENQTPAAAWSNHSEEGLIIGADSEGELAATPVFELSTKSGDFVVSASHHGHGYKNTNEDRVALVECDGPFGPTTALFVVDGMGGREHGDLAAQILSEELILAARPSSQEIEKETRDLVEDGVETVLWQLPSRDFIRSVLAKWRSLSSGDGTDPGHLIHSAREVVNSESLHTRETTPEKLRRIAEVLQALAGMKPPDPCEVAMRRTRRRIADQYPGPSAPDACFVGALIHTQADGHRTLDVRQVGDCRMIVADADGHVRFRTLGESVLPEPDLDAPKMSLTDLMAYSLHRNLVRNSVNSPKAALKRYRREDVPVTLRSGDLVCLYSDGIDDLFSPEEIVDMARCGDPRTFARDLLQHSERRMKYVDDLLRAERQRLPAGRKMQAYPSIHERLNRARIEFGRYVERYADGSSGSWVKPPKCDNASICALFVS